VSDDPKHVDNPSCECKWCVGLGASTHLKVDAVTVYEQRQEIIQLTSDLSAARSLAEERGEEVEKLEHDLALMMETRRVLHEGIGGVLLAFGSYTDDQERGDGSYTLVKSWEDALEAARTAFVTFSRIMDSAALAPSTETRQDEMDRLAGKGAREVAEFRSQHIGDPFAPGHICFKCAAPSTDATPEG
jgi:hypothetical protein